MHIYRNAHILKYMPNYNADVPMFWCKPPRAPQQAEPSHWGQDPASWTAGCDGVGCGVSGTRVHGILVVFAAVRGVGTCRQYHGNLFASFFGVVLPMLPEALQT